MAAMQLVCFLCRSGIIIVWLDTNNCQSCAILGTAKKALLMSNSRSYKARGSSAFYHLP
jgi:hypothetical protein